MAKGFIFQNEDGYYQGPFCEEVTEPKDASIFDTLQGIQTENIHKVIPIEYKWINGTKVLTWMK